MLGDIGVHILDFASYGSGLDIDHVFARLKTFDKAPGNKIGEYELDANDSFTMAVDFTNGALGVIHATPLGDRPFQRAAPARLWREGRGRGAAPRTIGSQLRVVLGEDVETGTWKEMEVPPVPTNYQRFAEAVRTGENQEPSFRHAAELQRVLDLAMVSEAERKELAAEARLRHPPAVIRESP